MDISVVIPLYNEDESLPELTAWIERVMAANHFTYEIIMVDDGSSDNSWALIETLSTQNEHIRAIKFRRNYGKSAALHCGFQNAQGDVVITMDADMQDPPELIPDLLEVQERENANVVYCVRKSREGESLFKLFTSKAFYRVMNYMSEVHFPLDTGDFRLVDRKVMNEFDRFKERGKYIRGLISWVGFHQVPFYYEREARIAGETKYPISKMLKFASTAMLYFSKKPLRLATSLGFISVLVGIILAVWFTLGKIYGFSNAEVGWTSIMTSIIFFGGVQLLTVGVLGQYVGILFDEIKARPEYIIDEKKNY